MAAVAAPATLIEGFLKRGLQLVGFDDLSKDFSRTLLSLFRRNSVEHQSIYTFIIDRELYMSAILPQQNVIVPQNFIPKDFQLSTQRSSLAELKPRSRSLFFSRTFKTKSSKPAKMPDLTDQQSDFAKGFMAAQKLLNDKEKEDGGDVWKKRLWFFAKVGLFVSVSYFLLTHITFSGSSSMSMRPFLDIDNEIDMQGAQTKQTFNDVHGCDECKSDLQEIVAYLKDPNKFTSVGARLPRGVLLVGPSGTGKTLLARAVAGEAGVPFYYASGSQFDEIFVGLGSKRVRTLFEHAKKNAPSVIFIDELDAVGGKRTNSPFTSSAHHQTINQLLSEMDGFTASEGVIVIAATNFPEMLDHALTRPGRLDVRINVPLPDVLGRQQILQHYLGKVHSNVDFNVLENLAKKTVGMTGAELENLVNQAALRGVMQNKKAIGKAELDWAEDKLRLGSERKSAVMSRKELENTAFHEAGHALLAYYTKNAKKIIYKATILARGQTLGHTAIVPVEDKHSVTKAEYLADLDILMGGRVAEELIFGSDFVTTGASNDLERATKIARSMVLNFGMSEEVGLISEHNYNMLSPTLKETVDTETRRLLKESYERAKKCLISHSKELHLVANQLLEHETLSGTDIQKLIESK